MMDFDGLIVIVVAFFLGYWAVSHFYKRGSKPQNENAFNSRERAAGGSGGGNSASNKGKDKTSNGTKSQQSFSERPVRERWHEILEVSPDASLVEIRQAYKVKIGQYHPDKVSRLGSELRELAEKKAKEINSAFDYASSIRS